MLSKSSLVLLAVATTACGKQVHFGEIATRPNTSIVPDVPVECQDVMALASSPTCQVLQGGHQVPGIVLEISFGPVPGFPHNQPITAQAATSGSGWQNVGTHLFQTNLRTSGQCAVVNLKVITEPNNPGTFTSSAHPGHFEVCQDNSTELIVHVEQFNVGGAVDFNDAQFVISNASTSQSLSFSQHANGGLLVCVE